jgi:putative (di)nucleoside polyphosphate hydrolase
MSKFQEYRPNVAAIVLSCEHPKKVQYLLAKKKGARRAWQFPQGGIDGQETPKEALLRELKEEIGTNDVEIVAEYPEWIRYDFPNNNKKCDKLYPFKGQNQKYFLVRLKDTAVIKLDLDKKPEFEDYVFVDEAELFKKALYMKRRAYRRVIDYFKEKGFI